MQFEGVPTMVFVDYEAWRYGLLNDYETNTDLMGWFADVKKKGRIEDIFIFGDLTTANMQDEIFKLRSITNNIIDCRKTKNLKDFTDFIMLDHIYQKLIKNPHIKQFIIFSGDSHFQSAIVFLKNFQDKQVGVYAIKGTLSEQLKNSASWYVEISPPDITKQRYIELLIRNLKWAESKEGLIPSFGKTVSSVSSARGIEPSELEPVLIELIDQGYIRQEDVTLSTGQSVRALKPDWERIESDLVNEI